MLPPPILVQKDNEKVHQTLQAFCLLLTTLISLIFHSKLLIHSVYHLPRMNASGTFHFTLPIHVVIIQVKALKGSHKGDLCPHRSLVKRDVLAY